MAGASAKIITRQAVEMVKELTWVRAGGPKKVRTRLLEHFAAVRSFPGNHSDYHESDAIGRRIEISVLGGWAIHYWIDGADRHVKVLALKAADK